MCSSLVTASSFTSTLSFSVIFALPSSPWSIRSCAPSSRSSSFCLPMATCCLSSRGSSDLEVLTTEDGVSFTSPFTSPPSLPLSISRESQIIKDEIISYLSTLSCEIAHAVFALSIDIYTYPRKRSCKRGRRDNAGIMAVRFENRDEGRGAGIRRKSAVDRSARYQDVCILIRGQTCQTCILQTKHIEFADSSNFAKPYKYFLIKIYI